MKAHTHKKVHSLKRERGQALVEMALILPFLLVLVIGIVEAGLALNRQLTVVNAAREGARFGSFGASADDVHTQTLLATSQMFEFTEENAVVAVIHAETNDAGDGFDEWTETVYPADATIPHVTQGEVLEQLNEEGDAADLKLVVVDVRYDHESMLGLPFVGAMADQIPINSWTVMRLAAPPVRASGCCVYPIGISASKINWPDGLDKFTPLDDIRIGDAPGQFGWLFWDPDTGGEPGPASGSAPTLIANLKSCWSSKNDFQNACDSDDTVLTAGDWISGDSGQSVADGVIDELEKLLGKYIMIVVWQDGEFLQCKDIPDCDCKPGSKNAHAIGFVQVKVTDVCLKGPGCNPKVISAEFIKIDHGCD